MKKNNSTILKMSLYTAAFLGIFTFVSCNQNTDSNGTDTKEIAEDNNNDAKFSDTKEDDAEFLVSAAAINLEEIQLGQLAQKNSKMPEVIELGKMMEVDHTKAQKELQALATRKQIDIPTTLTDDGMDAYNKLKDKFGKGFDNDYCDMMVKGHKGAIDKFEKASNNTKDPDIKSWTETMLISLKSHLSHSEACQEKCEKLKS